MKIIRQLFKMLHRNHSNEQIKVGLINSKTEKPDVQHALDEFKDCADLVHCAFPERNVEFLYFAHLIDKKIFDQEIIHPLCDAAHVDTDQLFKQPQFVPCDDLQELIKGITEGKAAVFHIDEAFLVDVYGPEKRSITPSENESVISGANDAFIESSDVNLSLIRRRIKSPKLKVLKLTVGSVAKTNVFLLYIQSIANENFVDELKQRIQSIEIEAVYDTNMLIQLIDEVPNSVFPQFFTTERPDHAVKKLLSGKIIGIVDGSPHAFSSPTGFFEFFQAMDDYNERWIIGSGLRLLRYLAVFVTVTFTPMYVAITTFHYEMIPESLLIPLAESRSKVPFPPIIEAIFMEATLELLREAGVRLPTKIGQTIGIVGGIVIGQASVQAGITSNILIIAVAISAIASFVVPHYQMSQTFRLIRFGLILFAGLWGMIGLVTGIMLIVIHLCGITNLRTSYLIPLTPMFIKDWKDIWIRASYPMLNKRPVQSKSPHPVRHKIKIRD